MDNWGKRLSAGEKPAFATLYDACADRLHHYLSVRLRSREDASEVLQETFLRLVRGRRQFTQVASSSALTQLVYPSLVATREAIDRVRASTRCLIVLNALQAAELDANEPPRADRLGLDVEHVTEPCDGEPLRIKHTPAGYVDYSVGRNGKDDGGAIGEPHLDIGAGPLAR